MNPFLQSQIIALIEDLRLIEAFVTAPLGLNADIKMVRQALPFDEARDLDRTELGARRSVYQGISDRSGEVAHQVITQAVRTLDLLESVKDSPTKPEWIAQSRRVLARAEQKVAGDERVKTADKIKGLYVIVGPDATNGRPVVEVADAALNGGASVLQLRDKTSDRGDVLPTATKFRDLCYDHGALFFMNDDVALGLSSGADGVHLGQTDLPVPDARRILDPSQLIGRSNNSVDEVAESVSLGVDYIAVGAIFPTSTVGKSTRPTIGRDGIKNAKDIAPQPIVAIGGINEGNVAEVIEAGASCVAVISAVTMANDPEAAARRMVDAIENARS